MNFSHHGDRDDPWCWSRGGRTHNSNSERQRSRSPIQKVLRDRVEEEKPPPVRNFGDYDPVTWSRRNSAPTQFIPQQRPNQEEPQYHNQMPREPPKYSYQYNQYYSDPAQDFNPSSFTSYSQPEPLTWELRSQETLLTSDDLVCLEPGRYEILFREKVQAKNLTCNLKRLPDFYANGITLYSYSMDFWPFRNLTIKETVDGQRNPDKLQARENLFSAALWKLESLMPGTYGGAGYPEQEPQPFMPNQSSSSSSRVVLQNRGEGEEPQFKIAIPRGPSIVEGGNGNNHKNYGHINKKRRH